MQTSFFLDETKDGQEVDYEYIINYSTATTYFNQKEIEIEDKLYAVDDDHKTKIQAQKYMDTHFKYHMDTIIEACHEDYHTY